MPLLLLFAFTLFTSATLLFLVQPMIGKMLLPFLGGTPAVWNTCMVFFQALLLAGYGYAHATTAWLGARRQAVLHLAVLLLPFLTLSLTVDPSRLNYGESSPIPGLLLVLLLSVGLPFFVVSTSAPLIQKWFAETGHPAAKDPYFLYGASNLGSMLALFGYPALVEPGLTLEQQRLFWRIGYGVLVGLTALCAVALWWSRGSDRETEKHEYTEGHESSRSSDRPVSVTLARRARWVLLAFVPSSLMLGVTTYMTTDIAAIPLLWVLPLGLYLLTFILVFSRLPEGVHRTMAMVLPYLVLPLVFLMMSEFPLRISAKIGLNLAVLFVAAMVCHGELARDRPSTRYLTEFYLWMSFGGVLGGLFNALVAPVTFNGIVEYPLVLVLACLLTPALSKEPIGPRGLAFGTLLTGIYLGAGAALAVPALGRADLTFSGLGNEGAWLLVALAISAALVIFSTPKEPAERAARWLDLGLPLGLGVLTLGLQLGMRISTMHRGIDRVFVFLFEPVEPWLPARLSQFLNPYATTGPLVFLLFIIPVALCAFFIHRPLRFGLGVGALLLATSSYELLNANVLTRQRSFFGALHVAEDGTYRQLYHGTTLHGQQRIAWSGNTRTTTAVGALSAADPLSAVLVAAAGQDFLEHPGREPLTYFHRTGPIGQIFLSYRDQLAGKHIGLIGLGSGSLAAYGQPGQTLTYYEIDPLVKHLAFDAGALFSFVEDARHRGVHMDLVIGDARLKLEERARSGPPDKFALLVVDAFSSDSIPIHLLTREALKVYLDNLDEPGVLAIHISNRYLNLEPVLANLAEEQGLAAYMQTDFESGIPGKTASHWVVLARHESDLDRLVHAGRWEAWKAEQQWGAAEEALGALAAFPDPVGIARLQALRCLWVLEHREAPWRPVKVEPRVGIWTDDYSNLLRVVYGWKY